MWNVLPNKPWSVWRDMLILEESCQLPQSTVLPGFSAALRASWKPGVIKTNVKSWRNTAEMRTVASSKLSGASPVLFWRNVLNIKLLMLTKGFGSIVESFAFIPQWSC